MRLAGSRSALARTRLDYPDSLLAGAFFKMQQRAAAMPANASFHALRGTVVYRAQAEAVNVRRSGCPKIEDGKSYYGSVASQSTTMSQISVGAIQAQCYRGDIFYWARITQIVSDGSSNVFPMGANRKLIKSEIASSTSNRGSAKIVGGMHQEPGSRHCCPTTGELRMLLR